MFKPYAAGSQDCDALVYSNSLVRVVINRKNYTHCCCSFWKVYQSAHLYAFLNDVSDNIPSWIPALLQLGFKTEYPTSTSEGGRRDTVEILQELMNAEFVHGAPIG